MIAKERVAGPARRFDYQAYQRFWGELSLSEIERLEGKHLALEQLDDGWQVVASADSFDELLALLGAAKKSVGSVVFDRIHREDETAPGIELQ